MSKDLKIDTINEDDIHKYLKSIGKDVNAKLNFDEFYSVTKQIMEFVANSMDFINAQKK